jgi:hypothetical protein
VTPLGVRFYEAVPWAPIWSGLALLAVLLLAAAAFFAALGQPLGERLLDYEAVSLVILAYAPTAVVYELRAARRDLLSLGPILDLEPAALAREIDALSQLDQRWYTVARLAGVAIGVVFSVLPGSWGGERPPLDDPVLLWVTLRSALLGWALMATSQMIVEHGRRFARIGRDHARIDLLEPAGRRPFGRQGLRGVTVWLGLSILFSMLLLAPWGRDPGSIFAGIFAVLAGVALWLPASGVHARLVEARDRELDRVHAAIEGARDANLASSGAVDARLANLVAYRTVVEGVRTWPFDLSTWLRFAAYVVLGLGSWLGGALVERLLGVVLGS